MKQHFAIDWTVIRNRLSASKTALEAALQPDESAVREAFERRARLLAERRAASVGTANGQALLVFRIGTTRFAIEIRHVVETGRLTRCTLVPSGPATLHGVFSHRGEVCSAIELGVILGCPSARPVGTGYFVHLRYTGGQGRFRVDNVEEILTSTDVQDIAAVSLGAGIAAAHVRGMTSDGIVVLRVDTLLGALVDGSQPAMIAHSVGTEDAQACLNGGSSELHTQDAQP